MTNDIQTRTDIHFGLLLKKQLIIQLYLNIVDNRYRPKDWASISHAANDDNGFLFECYKILQNLSITRERRFAELKTIDAQAEEARIRNYIDKEALYECCRVIWHRAMQDRNVSQQYMKTHLGWPKDLVSRAHSLLIGLRIMSPNQCVVKQSWEQVSILIQTHIGFEANVRDLPSDSLSFVDDSGHNLTGSHRLNSM